MRHGGQLAGALLSFTVGCTSSGTGTAPAPSSPVVVCPAGDAGEVGVAPAAIACDPSSDPGHVVSISSGLSHTCALFSGGTVKCWGDNLYGQLGIGVGCLRFSPIPQPVSNLCGVKAISAGFLHTCALLVNGTVKCWGQAPGAIADTHSPITIDSGVDEPCDTLVSSGKPSLTGSMPGQVPCLTRATAIAAGNDVDCALIADGTVRCWGWAGGGGLGNGTGLTPLPTSEAVAVAPVPVSGVNTAVGVAVGASSGCAALSNGDVRCWGQNESGELGDGTTNAASTPVTVTDVSGAVAVTADASLSAGCPACYGYSCALGADGTVHCWGEDPHGELGNGTSSRDATTSATAVSDLAGVVSIGGRGGHVVALLADGTIAGWGANDCGELGDGTTNDVTSPVHIPTIDHVTAVSAGECFACALLSNGVVECWGTNDEGELGGADLPGSRGQVRPPSNAVQVKLE